MKHNVTLDVFTEGKNVVINLVFLDTGEIRQKRRSFQWLANRIFLYEKKTRKEAYNVENGFVRVS